MLILTGNFDLVLIILLTNISLSFIHNLGIWIHLVLVDQLSDDYFQSWFSWQFVIFLPVRASPHGLQRVLFSKWEMCHMSTVRFFPSVDILSHFHEKQEEWELPVRLQRQKKEEAVPFPWGRSNVRINLTAQADHFQTGPAFLSGLILVQIGSRLSRIFSSYLHLSAKVPISFLSSCISFYLICVFVRKKKTTTCCWKLWWQVFS